MTSDNKFITHEHLLVQLALQHMSESRAAIGPEPTTEELISLREGKLDSTRRAQVISHIASSPNIYADTLGVTDIVETLDISAPTKESDTLGVNSTFSLKNWFKSTLRLPTFVGAGLAAVLALVVVQFTPPQGFTQDISQLYADYGQRGAADFRSLPHFKHRGKPPLPNPTEEQSPIYYAALGGVYTGMMELGKSLPTNWFPIEGYHQGLLPDLQISHFSATYELGRLTAISHFKCQSSNESNEFFTKAAAVMKRLSEPMTSLPNTHILSKQLLNWLTEEESAREQVCGFTKELTDFLWQPPKLSYEIDSGQRKDRHMARYATFVTQTCRKSTS